MSQTPIRQRLFARLASAGTWRWTLWLLHVGVVSAALLSLLTRQFELWVDLRLLRGGGSALEIVWAVAAALVPFLAGPNLRGWLPKGLGGGHPRWVHAGFSPVWARRLLWPTYLLLAGTLANMAYYFVLWGQGRADFMVPAPALAALVLSAWVLLTRQWLRRGTAGGITPATRGTQFSAAGLALFLVALLASSFMLHVYRNPPPGPVDLAVVLGGGLRPDGTASIELRQRVLAAADLYQRGLVKHILLSGGFEPQIFDGTPQHSELAAMRQVCLDAGVPEEAFSIDPVGENTKATAFNTRDFMRAHGYHTVVACSSDYHLFRTHMCFALVGVEAFTLPAAPAEWRCADARATLREIAGIVVYTLNPHYRQPKGALMQLKSPRILVRKSSGTLELFDGPALVKSYACVTGRSAGDKAVEGDRKTPEGTFHIVFKNPLSEYHLSLGLDYPNPEDARRGLAAGLITQQEYDGIIEALESDLSRQENQKKLWYTKLGGEIFIHGHGEGRIGTAGCIALSNEDVDELYAILPLGTDVEIRP